MRKGNRKQEAADWAVFLRQLPKLHMPWLAILIAFGANMGMQTLMLKLPKTTASLLSGSLTGAALAGAVWYYVLLGAAGFVQVFLQMTAENLTVRRARESLWNKMLHVKMDYYEKNDPSSLMSAITNDLSAGMTTLTNMLIYVIPSIYYVAAALMQIHQYDPLLTIACIAVFPLKYIYLAVVGKRYFTVTEGLYTKIGGLTSYLADRISHLHIIKSYTNEPKEQSAGNDISKKLYQANMRVTHASCLNTGISSVLNILQNIIVIVVGVLLLQEGRIDRTEWVAFFLFSTNLFTSFDSVAFCWLQLKNAQGSISRSLMVMTAEEEDFSGGNVSIGVDCGDVSFERVSFTYESGDAPAVKDMSFTIPSGSSAAFVGLCGSGKTTILNLLERFYAPQEGQIKVGGVPVEEYSLEDYRRRLCYVQQGADIFGGTVREALTYGIHRQVTDEELLMAAEQAGFSDYIRQHPQGLDAQIASGGSSLSGGQSQRLVLAREFLRGGNIVLMDEPSSALDADAVRQVRQAMDTLFRGKTLIVVSHDLHLITSFDQIFVMENGVCVGRGSHEALLETCPLYRRMFYTADSGEVRS